MKKINSSLQPFYRIEESKLVKHLINYVSDNSLIIPKVEMSAYELTTQIIENSRKKLNVENLMALYPLETKKGRNIMAVSECLLRIKDATNSEKLIIEKVKSNNWLTPFSNGVLLYLTSLFLHVGSKILPKNRDNAIKRFITSSSRKIANLIINKISYQFVLSQDIEGALEKSKKFIKEGYSFSYDMLGESATTEEDSERYFKSYCEAIIASGKVAKTLDCHDDVSVSIKLSSLHCRYEVPKYNNIKSVIYNRLLKLCLLAKEYDLLLFIDAEETERLVLSLDLIKDLLAEEQLKDWNKLGLAVQCYQKRGFFVIDEIAKLAKEYNKKLHVRLVKGAYWDREIKNDQVNGVEDFSLFTCKENTDIAYMACAKKMSLYENEIYPCFATHNAFSIAYIQNIMGDKPYEFQCLQGMGEIIYKNIIKDGKVKVRKYAPVGEFESLLPYLVRRLIENGTRSSFVNQIMVKDADIKQICSNPIKVSNLNGNQANRLIKKPRDIFIEENRLNSKGDDMSDIEILSNLEEMVEKKSSESFEVSAIINGEDIRVGDKLDIINPSNLNDKVGIVYGGNKDVVVEALNVAYDYFPTWNNTPVEKRSAILNNIADLLEAQTQEFIAILVREAGKTIKDSILEIREAVDFLRYYAHRANEEFSHELNLPGPVGEKNTIALEGRGVFLCIAPWNFPLAIFLGQVAAALAAGNTVIAKAAEDSCTIGYKCVKLMLDAGLPKESIQYLPYVGSMVGDAILSNYKLGGVAFTGSNKTALNINRKLAEREDSIIPLIAETGGQNAMIVDSTALLSQVVMDVVKSSFQSAGQRCSALRVMFVQEDIADELLNMLNHAMQELTIGDPKKSDIDVGPVINQAAKSRLEEHVEYIKDKGKLLYQLKVDDSLNGYYFAPMVYEINSITDLKQEVFGPILHVIKYKVENLETLVNEINSTKFGLTFAIHSRLEENIKLFSKLIRCGNIYVNRNQIGAVVGSQPFGGMGCSGTGPKAGGAFYLHKFAVEKVICEDLNASGGDMNLLSNT